MFLSGAESPAEVSSSPKSNSYSLLDILDIDLETFFWLQHLQHLKQVIHYLFYLPNIVWFAGYCGTWSLLLNGSMRVSLLSIYYLPSVSQFLWPFRWGKIYSFKLYSYTLCGKIIIESSNNWIKICKKKNKKSNWLEHWIEKILQRLKTILERHTDCYWSWLTKIKLITNIVL